MPSARDVLTFPPAPVLRVAKARLRDNTPPAVKRLCALAPVLYRRNPKSVPVVEEVMRNLIGDPPDGGKEQDPPRHATAAHGVRPPRKVVRLRRTLIRDEAAAARAALALALGKDPVTWLQQDAGAAVQRTCA